jgi:hypothetical protein
MLDMLSLEKLTEKWRIKAERLKERTRENLEVYDASRRMLRIHADGKIQGIDECIEELKELMEDIYE